MDGLIIFLLWIIMFENDWWFSYEVIHICSWLKEHVHQVLTWQWWMNYHGFHYHLFVIKINKEELWTGKEERTKIFQNRSHECIVLTAASVKTQSFSVCHITNHSMVRGFQIIYSFFLVHPLSKTYTWSVAHLFSLQLGYMTSGRCFYRSLF